MHGLWTIYGHIKPTICAADGKDSFTGLKARHADESDDHHHHQYIEECVTGVSLMGSCPPETSIKASTWDSREITSRFFGFSLFMISHATEGLSNDPAFLFATVSGVVNMRRPTSQQELSKE